MTGPYVLENSSEGLRFLLYNTRCQYLPVTCRSNWKEVNDGLLEAAMHVNKLLNIYDDNSELSRLNDCAREGISASVSEELYEALVRVWMGAAMSGGVFDPTIEPLLRAWDFKRIPPEIPARPAIVEALAHTGYQSVRFDSFSQTLAFSRSGMAIDPGAWGKGYALEICAKQLEKSGINEGILDFGGNLCLLGSNPRSPDGIWTVDIQNPWSSRGETLGSLSLPSCSVSTSAGYDNFYYSRGSIYHHLLDPRSGYPADSLYSSVTVVCPSPFYSDILSTVFFIGGEQEGRQVMDQLHFTETSGYVLVDMDGQITVSPSLQPVFHTQISQEGFI